MLLLDPCSVKKRSRSRDVSRVVLCAKNFIRKEGTLYYTPPFSVKIYNPTGKVNKCSFIQPFITRTLVCRVADVADEPLRVPSSARHMKQTTTWVGVLWRPI